MGNNMNKIILNQKSYLLYDEMVEFKKEFDKIKKDKYDFILFPPIHYLSLFKDSSYGVGTQDFFSYKTGSFTGEVNLESLKDMGINYTLIGHFERRRFLGEPYETAKEKLFKSLSSKCDTILCIGEQKKSLKQFKYIKKELSFYLKSIESNTLKYLRLAYIPSNAVGVSEKSVDKISKTVADIKKYMKNKYKLDIEVYYGGSITHSNIGDIMEVCDGVILDKECTDIKILKELLKEI